MPILTVTSRGQVTFHKQLLQHLGIQPGDRIEVDLLPNGRVSLSPAKRKGSIDAFLGSLAGIDDKVATIEEINEAAAKGWAGIS